jgi:hypothetical protein
MTIKTVPMTAKPKRSILTPSDVVEVIGGPLQAEADHDDKDRAYDGEAEEVYLDPERRRIAENVVKARQEPHCGRQDRKFDDEIFWHRHIPGLCSAPGFGARTLVTKPCSKKALKVA